MVALLAGIAFVVGQFAIYPSRAPTHQGQSLSSWLACLTDSGWVEPTERTAAMEAVRQIGTNAILHPPEKNRALRADYNSSTLITCCI
jgi:hypothetical protein